jgi:gliding motility-associated-like protein
MSDNGCPLIRTGIGSIKILIQPVPTIAPPFPQCLKTINDSTVKLQWQSAPNSKYFKCYTIYRKTDNTDFQPIASLNNINSSLFVDTMAFLHIINNYCYYISSVNVCDSSGDNSRIICSLFKGDTTSTPVFTLTEDTLITMYAFDTLTYSTAVSAVDPKDSVYMQYNGNMIGNSRLLSLQSQNNISTASLQLKWVATCDGVQAVDTPYLHFYVKDNQCPSPRNADGIIRIVVLPPPPNHPPVLSCIKFVNKNTVEIQWPQTNVNKYFHQYMLLKRAPNGIITDISNVPNANAFLTQDHAASNNMTQNYCYAVTTQDVCGYFNDTTPFKCTVRQPSDYPDAVTFYTVTVSGNQNIAAYWKRSSQDNFLSYSLYRRTFASGAFSKIFESTALTDTLFMDQQVKVQDSSYCYKITQVNECGLESQVGDEACSILLKGHSDPFEHSLKWNGYNYWNLGVSNYDIMRIQPGKLPELISQTPDKDTVTLDDQLNYDNGLYQYYVVAHEGLKGGGNSSTSNQVDLVQAPLLHVPNAFTPNNDQLNDDWNVVPVFVKDFQLKLYDRWGKLVFETNDKHEHFKGIDTTKGTITEDVFVYVITYTGWDSSSHLAKGNVTVLR